MNRYTYKAKRKDNQEWVYGLLIRKRDLTFNNEYDEFYAIQDDFFEEYRIDEQTLSQCTGLQDIECNYIFENDKVKLNETMYEIFWNDYWQGFYYKLGEQATDVLNKVVAPYMKIIGNKFDDSK